MRDYMFFQLWNGMAQAGTPVFASIFVGVQKFGNRVVRLVNVIETDVRIS